MEYLKEEQDIDCAIPCLLNNCTRKVVKKWTMCLTWTCETPDSPILPPLHPMAIGTIVGFSFLTVVFTLLLAGAVWKLKTMYKRRHHQLLPDQANEDLIGESGESGNHPSIISKC